MSRPVFRIRNLEISVHCSDAPTRIVDGVSFDLRAGHATALVGESGCGKSLTAKALMGILPRSSTTVTAHRYLLAGQELGAFETSRWNSVRGRDIAMVFQDPMTALDPVFSVGQQLKSVIKRRGLVEASDRSACDILKECGFDQPREVLKAYPHELSGGMRQLVMIAMAIAARPRVLIADEPTTALDVTTQSHVIGLLRNIVRKHKLALLLVTHDLGVAAHLCSEIMVMYCGRLVETGRYDEIYRHARHPYTRGLLAAIPRIGKNAGPASAIPGQVPPVGNWQGGCRFAPRCQWADAWCEQNYPRLEKHGPIKTACHHPR